MMEWRAVEKGRREPREKVRGERTVTRSARDRRFAKGSVARRRAARRILTGRQPEAVRSGVGRARWRLRKGDLVAVKVRLSEGEAKRFRSRRRRARRPRGKAEPIDRAVGRSTVSFPSALQFGELEHHWRVLGALADVKVTVNRAGDAETLWWEWGRQGLRRLD